VRCRRSSTRARGDPEKHCLRDGKPNEESRGEAKCANDTDLAERDQLSIAENRLDSLELDLCAEREDEKRNAPLRQLECELFVDEQAADNPCEQEKWNGWELA